MRKYNFFKLLPASGLLLLLVSCFATKTYQRPVVVSENRYRTDTTFYDSLSTARVSWTAMFTDTILQKHIRKALAHNIDVNVALQQIIAAEAYLRQAKVAYFPTLNGKIQFVGQKPSVNGQFGNQLPFLGQYELSGNLSWEADIWGKIRSNKRASLAAYLQTVSAHKAIKTKLISQIATTYYQLISLDEQMRITKETIFNRKHSLEITKALKKAGKLTEVAVKQTEAQLYTAQGIIPDLKAQIRLLENVMSVLSGMPPGEIPRADFANLPLDTPLHTGVPLQLLRNRPDVIAAEYELINAFELTNVARSNFYPSFTLTASGGLQSVDFDKLFNANSLFATFMGGLTQPLINGRKIRTQYEVSKAQQKQAELRFKESVLTAGREVSDALYTYQAATEKIKIKEKEYHAYTTAANYSKELLNNGLANYLEVLQAEEKALNSGLNLIKEKYKQSKSIIDLYKALGGGWQ